jgi:hypothetical protein
MVMMTTKHLYTVTEVNELILKNSRLVISADESLLNQLKKGNWIGGTIPYFMTEKGGTFTKELLYVQNLTEIGINFRFSKYDETNISTVTKTGFDNGFTILIVPMGSPVHSSFGVNSLQYEDIFKNPIVGYVAGLDLSLLGKASPKVYFGQDNLCLENAGVALHIELAENQVARTEIINPNTLNEESPVFEFPISSFTQGDCLIDGKPDNLADYMSRNNLSTLSIPYVSDCNGALINRDIMKIDVENHSVTFFAPLYSDEKYRMANKIEDYYSVFQKKLTIDNSITAYSCLCVSYYKLGSLEGKKININGPLTFGEIAYQLLNQTAVYLILDTA